MKSRPKLPAPRHGVFGELQCQCGHDERGRQTFSLPPPYIRSLPSTSRCPQVQLHRLAVAWYESDYNNTFSYKESLMTRCTTSYSGIISVPDLSMQEPTTLNALSRLPSPVVRSFSPYLDAEVGLGRPLFIRSCLEVTSSQSWDINLTALCS